MLSFGLGGALGKKAMFGRQVGGRLCGKALRVKGGLSKKRCRNSTIGKFILEDGDQIKSTYAGLIECNSDVFVSSQHVMGFVIRFHHESRIL